MSIPLSDYRIKIDARGNRMGVYIAKGLVVIGPHQYMKPANNEKG